MIFDCKFEVLPSSLRQGYKITGKMNFLSKPPRYTFTYKYRLRIKKRTNVCVCVSMCVCNKNLHSIFSAMAGWILAGSVSFGPSWCPIGPYWKLLSLVKYFKSYVNKTILVKIRKFYNRVVFATNPVKRHIVRKVSNRSFQWGKDIEDLTTLSTVIST